MNKKIYDLIVSQNIYVKRDYENYVMQDITNHKRNRLDSWKYLFRLLIHYRVLDKSDPIKGLSEKKSNNQTKLKYPEMNITQRKDRNELIEVLCKYDVISFDIFDTLVFRAIEDPKDLFWLVGNKFNITNFKKIRSEIENEARKHVINGEVDIENIYEVISNRFGIDKQEGIKYEFDLETRICMANPYMKDVFDELIKRNKYVVATSNMYLNENYLKLLLDKCGYKDLSRIFVSCDYKCDKRNGELQRKVQENLGEDLSYIHIGDNYAADIEGSRMAGWEAIYYKNINEIGRSYRRRGMSVLNGSILAGLTNIKLHNGLTPINQYYECGYAYGGILVYGYCEWLNKLAKTHNIDKFIFLARDMDIVYKTYKEYFNDIDCDYVLASRTATVHLSMNRHLEQFLDWHVKRRIHEKSTIDEIFLELDLEFLKQYLIEIGLEGNMTFNESNYEDIKNLIYMHKQELLNYFDDEKEAAKKYFIPLLKDCKNVCIIDLGWKGSISSSLNYFINEECNLNVNIHTAVIASEGHQYVDTLISTDKFHSYIFSSQNNEGWMNEHNKNGNIWRLIYEMMFTSTEQSLLKYTLDENGNFEPCYLRKEKRDLSIIKDIQSGIWEFCKDYNNIISKLDCNIQITPLDAYKPLHQLLHNTDFCYKLFKDFEVCFLAGNVSEDKGDVFGKVLRGEK